MEIILCGKRFINDEDPIEKERITISVYNIVFCKTEYDRKIIKLYYILKEDLCQMEIMGNLLKAK